MMNRPELLAPAGSWEAFVAAVENGADAVYLGGKMFNARQSAANFDDEQLAGAVEYAHIRGAKVYVTVNILVADTEMEQALKFLYFLQNIGADAAIVQDLGLARAAREVIPELPLHASTQMTMHNIAGVEQLLEAGFSRIVLAREMSLEEIKRIKESTGADLEVFVHGALCIGYSGQCLLSSMIGGRSGNRGRCAQPCRMKYELVDRKGRPAPEAATAGEYLLSPRDLNISEHLPELIEAGINSFKVEGRMKRPEYVATVVRTYRTLIDRAMAGDNYYVTGEEKRDLAQIFNRDFTTGYFFGGQGPELMSFKRPNNRGVRLGRVKGFDRASRLVEIVLEEPLRVGDGLEVWVTEGGRVGFEVGEIFVDGRGAERAPAGSSVKLSIPGKVRPGDRIFKTHDADLMERARESFASPRGVKKIPLLFSVRAGAGLPLTLTVKDNHGHTGRAVTPSAGEQAQKRPLDREFLLSQLGRLGNTPFEIGELFSDIDGEVIYPVKEINEARRMALAGLEERLLASRRVAPVAGSTFKDRLCRVSRRNESEKRVPHRKKTVLSVSVGDLASLQAAVKAGADVVYFGGDSFRSKPLIKIEDIISGIKFCKDHDAKFVFSTPRITKENDLEHLAGVMKQIAGYHLDGVLAGNLGIIRLFAKHYPDIPLVSDSGLNIFNREALLYMLELGCSRVAISPELTMEQVGELAEYPVEVLVQGALELMVTEYCAAGSLLGGITKQNTCSGVCRDRSFGLRDRTGAVFPVETDGYCRMHIFNSRDLCLIEDINTLAELGVSSIRIEARRESPEYASKAVEAYRSAIVSAALHGERRPTAIVKEKLIELSPEGITKGHFYRGVV